MNNNFQQPDDKTMNMHPQDIEDNKVLSLFSYIGILFLIPLLACKNSQYARFHANQGIILFICNLIISVAAGILSVIPVVGFILCIILYIVELVLLVFAIIGIVNAVTGKAKELPLIGKFTILK
ncbi:MAG: DUF4870 domain-containing protein [Acutalibacteraceae bacterium]|nr:DUF4870 domain-containing protein [Acutalibacteraceae bacterium]